MHTRNEQQPVPLYSLEPDEIAGNQHFKVYHYEGSLPKESDLLIPHRKDYYLVVFYGRQSAPGNG